MKPVFVRIALVLVAVVGLAGCDDAQPSVAAPAPKAAPKPAPVAPAVTPNPAPAPDPAAGLPKTPETFAQAKAQAASVYGPGSRTLFCGCEFGTDKVVRSTCGYQVRADEELARRLAWEHVVPVRAFGAERACWKSTVCKDEAGKAYRGVRCCREEDRIFRTMENDLHNLAPVVAELAEDRSGLGFAELPRERRMYGMCDFEVDAEAGLVEPRESIRGDVARAYLYMRETYGDAVTVSAEELEMYRSWHEADPPDDAEIQRNAKITAIQGKANPFIPLAG